VQADLLPCFVAVQPTNWGDSGRFTSALRWQKSPSNVIEITKGVIEITIAGRSIVSGDFCDACQLREVLRAEGDCSRGSFQKRLGLIEGNHS
jgi:hypothetical protein